MLNQINRYTTALLPAPQSMSSVLSGATKMPGWSEEIYENKICPTPHQID